MVPHLNLAHFVTGMPHARNLRKRRDRTLRAVRPSRRNELWYRAELYRLVSHLKAAGAEVAADLRSTWASYGIGDASAVPNADTALARAARKFGNIEAVALRLAGIAAKMNLDTVDERLVEAVHKSIGIDISGVLTPDGPITVAMREAVAANVQLIVTVPQQYLAGVHEAVTAAWVNGERWENLVARIAHEGDVTDSRAKVIARDQTSKQNAAFNEVRQTSVGIEEYTWAGAMDQRERPSHKAMEGSRQKWSSPPMVDGEAVHPGEAILCRCVALPVLQLAEAA